MVKMETLNVVQQVMFTDACITILENIIFVSGSLNCAAFTAGIIEAVLNGANFVSTLSIHMRQF
jgi:hypothetical protein